MKKVAKSKPKVDAVLAASKQVPWPVDMINKSICVPENQLEDAQEDLMTQYFIKTYGFHIQSTIPMPKAEVKVEVKAPKIIPLFQEENPKRAEFVIGDEFEVKTTSCRLVIKEFKKDGDMIMQYTNRGEKHDILMTQANLRRIMKMELWKRIN